MLGDLGVSKDYEKRNLLVVMPFICVFLISHLASKVDCFAVLATHFHELTALADDVPSVCNVHVTALADENGLAMLYKIEPGSCDRSFGLHVAQVTDFPPDVIKVSIRRVLCSSEIKMTSSLPQKAKEMAAKLEDYSSELDQDDSEAAVKRRREEKQEGHALIDKFLDEIEELRKNTNSSSDNDKEFRAKAKSLLDGVKESKNQYIEHLLSSLD